MRPAPGFIKFGCPNDNYRVVEMSGLIVNKALSSACRFSTDHANSMQFIDVFRFGHNNWHGAKRFSAKVGIQAGNDDPNTPLCQMLNHLDDLAFKKLGFIYRNDSGIAFGFFQDFLGKMDGVASNSLPAWDLTLTAL
jgi:hypothetical protein